MHKKFFPENVTKFGVHTILDVGIRFTLKWINKEWFWFPSPIVMWYCTCSWPIKVVEKVKEITLFPTNFILASLMYVFKWIHIAFTRNSEISKKTWAFSKYTSWRHHTYLLQLLYCITFYIVFNYVEPGLAKITFAFSFVLS